MKHTRTPYADIGRTAQGDIVDKADCSVRALAVASGAPYEACSELFAKHGRKHNRGTNLGISIRAIAEWYPDAHVQFAQDGTRVTLEQFARGMPHGRYIVHVRGHALAVVDGIVCDWRAAPRRIVKRYWRIDTQAGS